MVEWFKHLIKVTVKVIYSLVVVDTLETCESCQLKGGHRGLKFFL